jgi:hypothetical protein
MRVRGRMRVLVGALIAATVIAGSAAAPAAGATGGSTPVGTEYIDGCPSDSLLESGSHSVEADVSNVELQPTASGVRVRFDFGPASDPADWGGDSGTTCLRLMISGASDTTSYFVGPFSAPGFVDETFPLPDGDYTFRVNSLGLVSGGCDCDPSLVVHKASFTVAPAPPVSRLAGISRYATSAAISAETFTPGVPVVYIANGMNFPDALSGAPVAGLAGGPVLLTAATALPPEIQAELARLNPAKIVILGGNGAVSTALETQLQQYTTGAVERLAGISRYATSAAISAETFTPGVPVAYIANGMNFPDALSGAPVAGLAGGPVLLTAATALPPEIQAELARLNPAKIVILGGNGAVSPALETQLEQYVD